MLKLTNLGPLAFPLTNTLLLLYMEFGFDFLLVLCLRKFLHKFFMLLIPLIENMKKTNNATPKKKTKNIIKEKGIVSLVSAISPAVPSGSRVSCISSNKVTKKRASNYNHQDLIIRKRGKERYLTSISYFL